MICIIISYHNWPQELGLIRYSVPFYDIFMGHGILQLDNGPELKLYLFSSRSMALGNLLYTKLKQFILWKQNFLIWCFDDDVDDQMFV
mgnify:FL=1